MALIPTLIIFFLLGSVGGESVEPDYTDYDKLKAKAKVELDTLSYEVLFKYKTERPFTGELLDEERPGTYIAKASGLPVFRSDHKYDSQSGWPSFTEGNMSNIVLVDDFSFGMHRIEVKTIAGEHLGHVFPDGPVEKGGMRYCINSAALEFVPDEI